MREQQQQQQQQQPQEMAEEEEAGETETQRRVAAEVLQRAVRCCQARRAASGVRGQRARVIVIGDGESFELDSLGSAKDWE
eukprot:550286-Rhodomonas_salina.1